jgi:hypothetical protein
MSRHILILAAIIITLMLGAVNIVFHFMPYSAPPVILILFVALTRLIEPYFQKKDLISKF